MTLIGRWTFAGLGGPWDETENWQELELFEDARLTHRGLELKQGGWARVRPDIDKFKKEKIKEVKQKTLISWIILDDLSQKRPGGSALTLAAIQTDKFDAIVFGEEFKSRDLTWTVGSSGHKRTGEPNDNNPSEKDTGKLVKIAISYGESVSDGTTSAQITMYRNDKQELTYSNMGDTPITLETWSTDDMEVLFGARHTLKKKTDDEIKEEPVDYLLATIVAAEIHDECLTKEQIAARSYTDPCTFVRRSASLQASYIGGAAKSGSYLATNKAGTSMELVAVTDASDNNLKERATLVLVPGLADPTMVSLQVYQPSGAYVVATNDGIKVERPNGTNDFRRRATFEKVPGLFGTGGWSFKSLSQPDHYLRHENHALELQQNASTDLFKQDATFTEEEGFVSDMTTELPLEERIWYLISNHKVTPNKVLAVLDNNKIGFVDLPSRPDATPKQTPTAPDQVLWRLERLTQPDANDDRAGLHRWKLINKRVGDSQPLDTTYHKDGLWIEKFGHTGQSWTIRPIPWMGSDYFAMTNDWIEPDGSTLGCDADASHTAVQAVPRIEPLDLSSPKQRWRFTFMSYVDGVERPTPPEHIRSLWGTNLDFGNKDVAWSKIRWQPVDHPEYAKTYPQYAGTLGMDYVATDSVSDWALATARTVLTNLLLTLKDRRLIDKFKGYRILIVGDGDSDESDKYPDIGNPEFTGHPSYRGGTDNRIARITEEMMCRYGITHKPLDSEYRKYDQTIHEFGHTIDMRLGLRTDLTEVQGGSYNSHAFPWWVQSWLNSAIAWDEGGTREGFIKAQPKYAAFVRKYFLANREWRPYEVNYKHGSPETAVLTDEDKTAEFTGFDSDTIE
jgi:hypothetical protein